MRWPVCFIVEGAVSGSVAAGPLLSVGGRELALRALTGSALDAVPDTEGWWWATL